VLGHNWRGDRSETFLDMYFILYLFEIVSVI